MTELNVVRNGDGVKTESETETLAWSVSSVHISRRQDRCREEREEEAWAAALTVKYLKGPHSLQPRGVKC
jgi:dihydroxyacid dehydratase/phosphogluconate dehydratase